MSKNVLNNRAVRISLACAPCRSRHLKCNGATPVCSRCEQEGSTCVWMKSRRGGRPRNNGNKSSNSNTNVGSLDVGNEAGMEDVDPLRRSTVTASPSVPTLTSVGESPQSDRISTTSSDGTQSSLIDLYYSYFHDAHPCVLPRRYLERKIQEQVPGIESLILVIQFIGSLYTSKIPSEPLEKQVKSSLLANQDNINGFEVQALVLYSTAVYWRDGYNIGKMTLDNAIDKGVFNLQMHRKEFAIENSHGDPVLAESWRRTWWMMFTTEIHMAAIESWPSFRTSSKSVDSTMELPCEDWEYETGCIPIPRSEQEYNDREFDIDDSSGYSSFAYLIGLLRSVDNHIASDRSPGDVWSRRRCTNCDAAVLGWTSLLPKHKRSLLRPDGKTDELLWKAQCLISVYVVEVHRPFSTLSYNPAEKVSSCAPPPPPERADPTEYWDAPCHTSKILTAIERLTDLLTLHSKRTAHSPFSICMIAATTVTHLSACKYVFRGEELSTARERIRAAIGTLEMFAEVWSQGKRISWEVKTIAREVLGVGNRAGNGLPSAAPSPIAMSTSNIHKQPDANASVTTGYTPGPIDWNDFAEQMADFSAADFVGFEDYLEQSFGGVELGFGSTGNSSDIAVS